MSFCFDVKEELCKIEDRCDACKRAELYGMVLFAQTVKPDLLKISTENVLVVNRLQRLSSALLGFFFEMSEAGVTYNAVLKGAALSRLYELLQINGERPAFSAEAVCGEGQFISFLRGAVLVGGYFSDPVSGYQFDLVSSDYATACAVQEALNARDIPCKRVVRRANYVVYLKDSQQIYDLLYIVGARKAAFAWMNVKIEKESNNNNNRIENCAAYNMDKALNKAVEQIQAIEKIEKTAGLSSLPEDLLYVAVLRRENPTSSLTELAERSERRLSKPSLSRKLNKIVEYARKIKG